MAGVVLVAHRREWAGEFEELARSLHGVLGDAARRIDHIGSTSVPGLPAKDVIDVQLIVERLVPLPALLAAGFEERFGGAVVRDHVPLGWDGPEAAWDKRFYARRDDRPVNLHVRASGSANERYALLFRDYLRSHDEARDHWAAVKAHVAAETGDLEAYTVAKDSLSDVLMADAEVWAAAAGWSVPPA